MILEKQDVRVCIQLALNKFQCQVYVVTVMCLYIPWNRKLVCQLSDYWLFKKDCFMEFVLSAHFYVCNHRCYLTVMDLFYVSDLVFCTFIHRHQTYVKFNFVQCCYVWISSLLHFLPPLVLSMLFFGRKLVESRWLHY